MTLRGIGWGFRGPLPTEAEWGKQLWNKHYKKVCFLFIWDRFHFFVRHKPVASPYWKNFLTVKWPINNIICSSRIQSRLKMWGKLHWLRSVFKNRKFTLIMTLLSELWKICLIFYHIIYQYILNKTKLQQNPA